MKKIRLVPQKQIKKAYSKNNFTKKINLDEEIILENKKILEEGLNKIGYSLEKIILDSKVIN